jgi:hypothetical protein
MFTGCKFTIFKNILRRLVNKNIFYTHLFQNRIPVVSKPYTADPY